MALGGEPILAAPLTRTRKSGELYHRPRDVEAQLRELLPLDAAGQLERANIADKGSPEHVKDECLVYLIYEAVIQGDTGRFDALAGLLLKRVVLSVARQLRVLGVNGEDIEDLHQEIFSGMMAAIAGGPRGEFFQIRFRAALRRQILKCYDAHCRRTRRLKREESLDAPAGGGDGVEGGGPTVGDLIPDPADLATNVEDHLLVQEAVWSITDRRHRDVYVLHYGFGWQIESTNPDEPTLSGRYERTPKTIRSWLRTAERQVNAWRSAKGV